MLLGLGTRSLTLAVALVYALFAASCFRLAVVNPDEQGLAIGEGLFTLLGALVLGTACIMPRRRGATIVVGTLPLVGWFVATPWNSGPPFLVASLVVPVVAAALLALGAGRRR